MSGSAEIVVDFDTFIKLFPYFKDKATEESVASAYDGVNSYISTTKGAISLSERLQTRGVYLATAHIQYLQLNPSITSQGKLASATEGSVSASFALPQMKNWFEYQLSLTPYGVELLAILAQVQPPMTSKPLNIYPYYGGL